MSVLAERYTQVRQRIADAAAEGDGVDVGPADGAAWLGEHGARWGLCQVYANEPWHFEALVEPGGTCPDLLTDVSGTGG